MARARNLKPGFFKNEDLAECSPWARLCFAGLWTLADRDGRLEDRPKRIKAELFPFDSVEVEPLLQELSRFGFLLRYEAEGRGFIQVMQFSRHQNPHHKEPKSCIPSPQSLGLLPDETTQKPEASPPCHGAAASDEPGACPGFSGQEADMAGGANRADSLFSDSLIHELRTDTQPGVSVDNFPDPSPYGAAFGLLHRLGVIGADPADPEFQTVVDMGVTDDEWRAAVAKADRKRRKDIAYIVGIVNNQRRDAQALAAGMPLMPAPVAGVTVPGESNEAYLARVAAEKAAAALSAEERAAGRAKAIALRRRHGLDKGRKAQ